MRYDSATKKVYVCDGTSWGQVGGSSTPDIQVATGALVTASCASTCTDTKTSTATCPAGYKFAAGNCYLPSSWSWSFANTATTYSCTVSVSNTARQIQAVAYCIK
ncbi:hypothetical protein GC177_11005 [bacterium]|nr:hypothetical protein [bacterium]